MILGNWDINWILALYSGQPQSIGCTQSTTSGMGCYPLVVGRSSTPNQTSTTSTTRPHSPIRRLPPRLAKPTIRLWADI